jgi:polar amino acid transport system substrate-binding protein
MAGGLAGAAVLGASATVASAQEAGSTWDRIMSTKKLRIGGVATGAPWTMKDPASGEWAGHFVAIARALATDMEVELEIVETTWGNAILDVQTDKIDVMFGMNPTPKRALAVDFSVPVYNSALVMICAPDFNPTTWEDLNKPEVKIAVDNGSAHDQVASRLAPKAEITRFRTLDEATLALKSRRVQAQSIFWMGGVRAVKRDPSLGKVVVPTPVFGSTSNAATRRQADTTFKNFLNTWIVYSQGLGLVRSAVVDSLAAVDVTLDDIPQGVTF